MDKKTIEEVYSIFLKSDKDEMYSVLLNIKKNTDSVFFDSLVKKVLAKDNFDLLSISIVSQYLNSNRDSSYYKLMRIKFDQLNRISKDSIWKSNYSNRFNSNSQSNAAYYELKKAVGR